MKLNRYEKEIDGKLSKIEIYSGILLLDKESMELERIFAYGQFLQNSNGYEGETKKNRWKIGRKWRYDRILVGNGDT